MPKFGTTRLTRYIDLSDRTKAVVEGRIREFVGEAAGQIRDGIVEVLGEAGESPSAPRTPPASLTGAYIAGWKSTPGMEVDGKTRAFVYNDRTVPRGKSGGKIPLWILLEFGTSGRRTKEVPAEPRRGRRTSGGMAPRPHVETGAFRGIGRAGEIRKRP